MNKCGICGTEVDFNDRVGELDWREWYLGRAIAEKFWMCKQCLVDIQQLIRQGRKSKLN